MKTIQSAQRFDYGQLGSVEMTPQGFMKIPASITRVGVFPYRDAKGQLRMELRHPDDVFAPESLATLRNAPVTLEHPPVMVDPTNFEQYSVGYTTDRVEVNRDLIEGDVIIADAEAQAKVRAGKREVSAGYLADLVEETGVYMGTPYDCRQKNIKYNHVAVVDRGRAGPEVRLRLDSADAVMEVQAAEFLPEGENDSMEKRDAEGTILKRVVIAGQEVELPAHAADVVQALLDRYDEMRGTVMDLEGQMKKDAEKKDVDVNQQGISPQVPVEQKAADGKGAGAKTDAEADEKKEEEKKDAEASIAALKKDNDDLKAKLDEAQAKLDEFASKTMNGAKGEGKMDSADFRTQVRTRVKLERAAEKILGTEQVAKFDSMSDDEIRAAVIKARHPKAELEGKSTVYLQTRFDSITEALEESETVRREMGSHLLGDSKSRMDSKESDPAAKRREMIEQSRKMYQQDLAASKR